MGSVRQATAMCRTRQWNPQRCETFTRMTRRSSAVPSSVISASATSMGVEVLALQSAAIVDHVAMLSNEAIAAACGGPSEVGGSRRCSDDELKALLSQVQEFSTKAGGSAANMARALAGGFGVDVGLIGARGADEWGELYLNSLRRAGVITDQIRTLPGPTGRSIILTSLRTGQRTMRTSLPDSAALTPDMLAADDFESVKWVFISAYSMYQPGLLRAAADKARSEGARVMMDLASWEVVKMHGEEIRGMLSDGLVACCICNEDEARELMGRPQDWSPEQTVQFLLQSCQYAVVTLGGDGCVAACRAQNIVKQGSLTESQLTDGGVVLEAAAGQAAGALMLREAAVAGVSVVDTTGAGDAFSSGFLYGLLRGLPLQKCASIGCLAGAAAVQMLGADMGPTEWQWLHQRLHSGLAAAVINNTPQELYKELLDAYALVDRIGVGAVFFGSARLYPDSKFYRPAVELARDVALLLGCPTWSGGGPGMMRAAIEGGMEAGLPVGAVKISREAGQEAVRTDDYLPAGASSVCKHMPTRKAALTDAGVRRHETQRTAYIFLPGGLGTMDELFAILTLIQLNKLDSKYPVPTVCVNYNGFYDGLMTMLAAFDQAGVVHKVELDGLYVAHSNEEVLQYLAQFYQLPYKPASV